MSDKHDQTGEILRDKDTGDAGRNQTGVALARDLIMQTKRVIENNFEGMLHLFNRRCD